MTLPNPTTHRRITCKKKIWHEEARCPLSKKTVDHVNFIDYLNVDADGSAWWAYSDGVFYRTKDWGLIGPHGWLLDWWVPR